MPLLLSVPGQTTGVSAALVERASRERSLATLRGAAGAITPNFLQDPEVKQALLQACILGAPP